MSNSNEQFNFDVSRETSEVTILHGQALERQHPKSVNITGTIGSPVEWMSKRFSESVGEDNDHVIVDRDSMLIQLVENEKDVNTNKITGRLEFHRKFIDFGINAGVYKTPFEMAEFIKMNRSYFENKKYAMDLNTQLRNFKAKVDRQIEQEYNPNKGDKRVLLNQVVNANVPDSFNVNLPVFKGTEKQSFNVEIYFNPDDLTCTLVSPEANDYVEETRDAIIDEQVRIIKNEWPGIPVIEV